jgi:competence protein ComEC
LLAPHHGSRTSSSEPFLRAVRPEYVLVQSGWQNQFRHPNPAVTSRYEAMGAQWFNTAHHGAAHWQFPSGQHTPQVVNALENRKRYWHPHEKGAQP